MKKLLVTILLIPVLPFWLLAQSTVEGYVTDQDGLPLPGVNIVIKGTTQGTITNIDGYYSLSDIPAEGILVYSFLGMKAQEIKVGDQTNISISMSEETESLDEVVVVGYGTVKRANLTGAVADIKAEELEDIPVGDLASALDGRLAGVKIETQTGKPGEASILRIRTESSYGRATEDVLYVIDGVITTDPSDFNLLDASEIESISVLKDAAAAVYGARAAGGVVVIQTKRGKQGKPSIKYSGSLGLAQATKFPEMLSGSELATMYNDALEIYERYGNPVSPYDYFAEDEIAYMDSIPGYNWLDEVLKTASTQKHTLNVSGGSDRIKYFVGGSYYNEDGMMDMLNFSRYSIRSNIEAQVTEGLITSLGINYTYSHKEEPNFTGESQSGVLRETYKQALTAAPWIPISIDGKPVNNFVTSNPLALLESGSYKNSYDNNVGIRAGLQYTFPFVEGLSFNFQFSRGESYGKGKEYTQDYTSYNFPTTGSHRHIIVTDEPPLSSSIYDNEEGIRESSDYSKNYQLNTAIHYGRAFGEHDVSALLVYEQSESEDNSFSTRIQQPAAISGYDYMWAFSRDFVWESANSAHESGNLGLIGRINYGYAQKYLFEGTFRYEASEKFHPDNRWGFFPAVSAGWVLSQENFFKNNIGFINFLKFRGSAGIVGNDNIESYLWTPTFKGDETGPIFGDNLTNAIEGRNGLVYIPSIHWQETNSYNAGLDMRIIDNHIRFTFDYYYRHTYEVFNRRTNIPSTVGLNTIKPPEENYGEADARGIEIELGYEGRAGEFGYNIDANFSWDRKKELKLFQNPAVEGSWKDDRLNDPSNQPGYVALGIMRTQDQLDSWMEQYPNYTINGLPLELGMIYYKDIRGEEYIDSVTNKIAYLPPDGIIDGNDVTIIAKYTSPPYHYGFSLGFSWKGFRINGTFTGIFGHKVFISKDEQVTPDPNESDINNVFGFWSDYWTEENPDAAFPRPFAYGLEEQNTTFWMRDGHTLRLKTLNVSYSLPAKVSLKIKIPELRLYFTSQNLWTIINPFDHKDPGISRGYDYPLMRTFNFGINITI